MRKWLKRTLATLLALLVVAAAVVYVGSERILRKSYAATPVGAPPPAGDAARGKHLAGFLGCLDCHDPTLHGNVIFPDSFLVGSLVAPNVTIKRKQYDDAALARTIRFGIRRDGTGIWLMPSQAFYHLDDQDLADVIAFVRSVADDDKLQPESRNGPVTRWNLVTGVWQLVPELVPVGTPRLGDLPHADDPARGRYIATIACGECHGLDQKGNPDDGIPNLAIVKAYDLDEFRALLHGGTAKGGRKLKGMMAGVVRRRFSALSDDEIAALKAYLDGRAP